MLSNKSMEVLINGCGFQTKRCTMLCWDCFYLAASSSPPWPGNHNTACGCIAVTTGGCWWRFSAGLPFSALSVRSFVFCVCIQAGRSVITFNLPDFPLVRWWNTELADACREVGAGSDGQGYTWNRLFLHEGSRSVKIAAELNAFLANVSPQTNVTALKTDTVWGTNKRMKLMRAC